MRRLFVPILAAMVAVTALFGGVGVAYAATWTDVSVTVTPVYAGENCNITVNFSANRSGTIPENVYLAAYLTGGDQDTAQYLADSDPELIERTVIWNNRPCSGIVRFYEATSLATVPMNERDPADLIISVNFDPPPTPTPTPTSTPTPTATPALFPTAVPSATAVYGGLGLIATPFPIPEPEITATLNISQFWHIDNYQIIFGTARTVWALPYMSEIVQIASYFGAIVLGMYVILRIIGARMSARSAAQEVIISETNMGIDERNEAARVAYQDRLNAERAELARDLVRIGQQQIEVGRSSFNRRR